MAFSTFTNAAAPVVVRVTNQFEYDLSTFADVFEFVEEVWNDVFHYWDSQESTEFAVKMANEAQSIAFQIWETM